MLQKLHLELTTRCILSCPGCPRTWFADTLKRPVPKQDVDPEVFRKFLDCDSAKNVTHFRFESNHGDPIYYPQLLEFLREWRGTKTFHLFTNGSRMSLEFWKNLNEILDHRDQITFSIDGLEDTNPVYRVNSDWESIMTGLSVMTRGPVRVNWKTVVFAHNQHQIKEIEKFAMQSGVDHFELVNSNRHTETTKPDSAFIDVSRLYDRSHERTRITPQCDQGGQLYISADGYAWPCCWISSYYTLHKTALWKDREQLDITKNTLDQILEYQNQFAHNVAKDPQKAHGVCRMMCGS